MSIKFVAVLLLLLVVCDGQRAAQKQETQRIECHNEGISLYYPGTANIGYCIFGFEWKRDQAKGSRFTTSLYPRRWSSTVDGVDLVIFGFDFPPVRDKTTCTDRGLGPISNYFALCKCYTPKCNTMDKFEECFRNATTNNSIRFCQTWGNWMTLDKMLVAITGKTQNELTTTTTSTTTTSTTTTTTTTTTPTTTSTTTTTTTPTTTTSTTSATTSTTTSTASEPVYTDNVTDKGGDGHDRAETPVAEPLLDTSTPHQNADNMGSVSSSDSDSSTNWIIGGVVLAVVLLIAIVVGGLFFMKKMSPSPQKPLSKMESKRPPGSSSTSKGTKDSSSSAFATKNDATKTQKSIEAPQKSFEEQKKSVDGNQKSVDDRQRSTEDNKKSVE